MTNQKKERGPPPKGSRSTPQRASPAFVTPMATQVVTALPEGDEWSYELKFDGYRALVIKSKEQVEFRSRKNKDLTGMYPGIAAAGLLLKADQAVIDGEIVAVDTQGSPSFQALQHRGSHPGHQIVFYAFDVLHVDGTDLTGQPLLKRRARLARVLEGSGLLSSQELPGAVAAIGEAVLLRRLISVVKSLSTNSIPTFGLHQRRMHGCKSELPGHAYPNGISR